MSHIGRVANKELATFRIKGTESIIVKMEGKEIICPLSEVNRQVIFMRRIQNIPTFVLKVDEKLYVADIEYYYNMNNNADDKLGQEHMCVDCMRCRALPEELGGCSKVRDCSIEAYSIEGNSYSDAVDLSKRIEKYHFIKYGYEAFGVSHEVFCVGKCDNYEIIVGRHSIDNKTAMNMKYSIDQYYFS